MKKIINMIVEINNASFAWYVSAGVFLYGATYIYPTLIAETGIPISGVTWLLGISALLRVYDIFCRKKNAAAAAGKRAAEEIISRLRLIALCAAVSILIFWALFSYRANRDIYNLIKTDGIRPAWLIALCFIAYWCIVISAATNKDKKKEVVDSAPEDIKKIYSERRERNSATRLSNWHPIRRYAHGTEYNAITSFIQAGETVLDAGCGDGSLAIMLAKKGAQVTACDISPENIAAGRESADSVGLSGKISFIVSDAEALPFPDDSFDWVVSSHVLEHLPDLKKGLAEIRRVTKKKAIIAMPTCLNPCAIIILGGDTFWTISRWSCTAWFVGSMRLLLNLGGEGVDEGYAGDIRLPHLWRYPWIMRRDIQRGSFRIIHFQASSFVMPYIERLIRLSKRLERYRASPLIRNFGYGSIAVVEK